MVKVKDVRNDLISTEDREFINQVYSDYEAAKEMKPTDEWQRYDDYSEDDQWAAASIKDEWKPKPQVNVCWKVLQTIHANMTSGRTSIQVTSRQPYYEDVQQQVSDVLEYYWDALDMDLKLSEMEWIRPKLGSVVLKAPWNPRLNEGDGDLDCEIVHPSNVFIDPNINNPWKIQKADFIDLAHPKTVKYIMQNYSKEADPLCKYTKEQLKQILVPESSFSDTEIYGDEVNGISSNIPVSIRGTDKSYRQLNHRDRVYLHEYWYKDDNGKLQVAWLAGWVLLKSTIDDKEMKKEGFYRHGKYPIVIIPYIQKDKRLWGRSELQALVARSDKRDGIQDIVNKLIQDYLVNHKLIGQGQVVYQNGQIKNPEKITGNPDLVIPTRGLPRDVIMRLQGVPIPGIMQAIEAFLTHADRITNMWDVTQGRSTPYTKTASGTMALLEQAMRPQNDKVSTLNQGLRELAEIWLENLAEFAPGVKEYAVNKAGAQKVFSFDPSVLIQAPRRMMTETGEINDVEGETRRLYLSIRIDVGATLALTKAYMVELGMNLFEKQALDLEGLYKLLPDFPGKQDALDRMKEMQEQQGGADQSAQVEQFVQSLPPEIAQMMAETMSPDEQTEHILEMMQIPPEQLEAHYAEMLGNQEMMPPEMAQGY